MKSKTLKFQKKPIVVEAYQSTVYKGLHRVGI